MNKPSLSTNLVLLALVCATGTAVADQPAPLTRATVTEAKNVVNYQPQDAPERSAKIGDSVKGADMVWTGERSLAELEFNDKTIVRLCSKTIFTFGGANREFVVNKGLMLLCMPKKAGGGRIATAAVTAAIEGTTVICEEYLIPGDKTHPPRRGTKFIFLEGDGHVFTPDGKSNKPIHAGEMVTHAEGDPQLADPKPIDIKSLVHGSGIVKSFTRTLPNAHAIQATIDRQQTELKLGKVQYGQNYTTGRGNIVQPGTPPALAIPVGAAPPYRDSGIAIAHSETPVPCNCP